MSAHRPSTSQEWAAYRRYIRENHPDAGGDPDAFAVGLVRMRATFQHDPASHQPDRYDAPVEFVSGTDRMRRRVGLFCRRLRRRQGPPRVL